MEPHRRLVPTPRPDVTASIQCIDCAWSAVHFGENAIEVSLFLRELYRRHLAERHPDLTFEER
jgi:hypothetical protein